MTRRPWTPAEIVTVVSRYPVEGAPRLAAELARSEHSINGLARRFGQRTPRKPYRRSTRRRTTAP